MARSVPHLVNTIITQSHFMPSQEAYLVTYWWNWLCCDILKCNS